LQADAAIGPVSPTSPAPFWRRGNAAPPAKAPQPRRTAVDRTLIQEILEVVEQAAIASAKLTGLGQKDEADAAAVEAMRTRMGAIQMKGRIVIGEGERDEAPMLYIGEEVGSGTGPGVDFAVDPCEGTNLAPTTRMAPWPCWPPPTAVACSMLPTST